MKSTSYRHPSRLIAIGLDGATYDVLLPLVHRGLMPHLGWLLRRSAVVDLESTDPAVTPVAWTSFQTGCLPHEHGILDFRYYDHESGLVQMNHADRLARPTLFDAVAQAGGQVVSLNLPMTWPAPPDVPGIVVGGIDSLSIEAALAPYPEFARRLIATSAEYNIQTIWKRRPESFDELQTRVAQTQTAFRSRVTAARLADEMVDWQLLVVQFQTLDSLQHRAWDLLGIDPRREAPESWTREVHQAFRTLDDCLGELCELATQRQAALVVVSDHGFGDFRGRISLPRLLESRGLLVPASRTAGWSYRLARTRWKVQKWWHEYAGPGTSSAAWDRPLEIMLPVDRQRSVAVVLHGNLGALVYLNTPERFGAGPVTSPRLYEQALAEVTAALAEARDPATDERLFTQVESVAERWQLDPLECRWPDLVAWPAPGYHTRTKVDRQREIVRPDPQMAGTHRRDGVLLVNAPGVQLGRNYRAHITDVAPTVLDLLEVPGLGPTSGRALREIFGREAAIPRPHFLERGRMARPSARVRAPRDESAVEDRLRQLGYLD